MLSIACTADGDLAPVVPDVLRVVRATAAHIVIAVTRPALVLNCTDLRCVRVVLLGGISSLQNHCGRIDNIELYALGEHQSGNVNRELAAVGDVLRVCTCFAGIPTFPATGGCSHFYQFWWYVGHATRWGA